MHIPVLLKEVVEILNPKDGELIIDGTVGAGGHTVEILKRISPNGILLGIDWDETAIKRLKEEKLKNCGNVILVQGNYANLPEILKKNGLSKADGLILDLGMSSDQLELGRAPNQSLELGTGRGFSFLKNEPLDMRYNINSQNLTAAEIVNSFRENDLADIFWKYGEERHSCKIAKKIVEERNKKRILTTFDLVEIIKKSVPKSYQRRLHPATKIFQALRIYVNRELENLEALLRDLTAGKILKVGGCAAIISFHSLEDRLVKNYFREMVKNEKAEILTKKPIRPTIREIEANPRARSAKLRAIRVIANNANFNQITRIINIKQTPYDFHST